MTYGCWNRERPADWLTVRRTDTPTRSSVHTYDVTYQCVWKDDGACQHDSARDEKCEGCKWRREEDRHIPQGDGGLSASTTRSIYDRKDERAD